MYRLSIAAAMLAGVVSVSAYGQQQQPVDGGPRATPAGGTRERPTTAAAPQYPSDINPMLMRQGGGSLLQAGRMTYGAVAPSAGGAGGNAYSATAAPVDPTKQTMRAFSPFAVPEAEPKLVRKHDYITIIVREESEASSQGTADLKRETSLDAHADQFIRWDNNNKALIPTISGPVPAANLTGNRSFKGEATTSRQDSFVTRITAEVLDVKPNGTLILQARKKIKNDEEEQSFVLSGGCRVEDITPDNTVLSTQLYDLEVSKTSKGQVRNSTKTGILHKLLDFLNLF